MRKKRPRARRPSKASAKRSSEEELQGPPPREALLMHDDRELRAEEDIAEYHATGPRLTGGDVDADWRRADSVGEEAVGGSVSTPDQDRVDELGNALGVPRSPDEVVRASSEILDERDRHRWEQER